MPTGCSWTKAKASWSAPDLKKLSSTTALSMAPAFASFPISKVGIMTVIAPSGRNQDADGPASLTPSRSATPGSGFLETTYCCETNASANSRTWCAAARSSAHSSNSALSANAAKCATSRNANGSVASASRCFVPRR